LYSVGFKFFYDFIPSFMTRADFNSILVAKKAAATAAVDFIQDGMLVGLGTGSTVFYFIEALGQRCRAGLNITAVATSQQSFHQAQSCGISLKDSETVTSLVDLMVDGADEIDPNKNMIKGGGGALFREKLLAEASRRLIIIVDETKLVNPLGMSPLPVEVARFLYHRTLQRLEDQGYQGKLRLGRNQTPFVTDNGNYIIDIHYNRPIQHPADEHMHLKSITGVVETGLFFNIVERVIIGYQDGYTRES
jgi:ribose 5-phosphate isomerase A